MELRSVESVLKMETSNLDAKDERLKKLKELILAHLASRRQGDDPVDSKIVVEIKQLLQQVFSQSQLQGTKTPSYIINFLLEAICLQRGSAYFVVETCSFALLRYLIMCRNEDTKLLAKLGNAVDPLKYLLNSVSVPLQMNALRSLEILAEEKELSKQMKGDKSLFQTLDKLSKSHDEEIPPRVKSLLTIIVERTKEKKGFCFFVIPDLKSYNKFEKTKLW